MASFEFSFALAFQAKRSDESWCANTRKRLIRKDNMTNNEAATATQTAVVAAPGAQVAPTKAPSKKGAPKGRKRATTAKPAAKATTPKKDHHPKPTGEMPFAREGTAKAKVIALLQRKDGATMDELRHATGWQPHTVRGLISALGSKHGMKVESRRREDGARVYEAVK